MIEDDELDQRELPSVRMGPLDVPIFVMSFITGATMLAGHILCDLTASLAKHANYLRDEREFRGIVRNYDYTRGIGPRSPEPED